MIGRLRKVASCSSARYSSRSFPTQARQSEFTGWPACSNARINSTASSSHRSVCTFRCSSQRDAERQVRAACAAAMEVRTEPFEVSFDRTASFRGRPGNRPFVLVGESGLRRLESFRPMLGAAMMRRGLRRVANTNFTPHVTLLYDARSVDEHPIEPIVWTVTEFVLIRSVKATITSYDGRCGHDRNWQDDRAGFRVALFRPSDRSVISSIELNRCVGPAACRAAGRA